MYKSFNDTIFIEFPIKCLILLSIGNSILIQKTSFHLLKLYKYFKEKDFSSVYFLLHYTLFNHKASLGNSQTYRLASDFDIFIILLKCNVHCYHTSQIYDTFIKVGQYCILALSFVNTLCFINLHIIINTLCTPYTLLKTNKILL